MHQQSAYLQCRWQSVVLFLILILRAVCVVKVQECLVVLLQKFEELWIFVFQPGQLLLVLRGLPYLLYITRRKLKRQKRLSVPIIVVTQSKRYSMCYLWCHYKGLTS